MEKQQQSGAAGWWYATPATRASDFLRPYAPDSPEAMARLLALTLLSDGMLESRELENLRRADAFDRIGTDQSRFMRVLYDFCDDLTHRGPLAADGHFRLSPVAISRMLREVEDPGLQREVVRLMLEVIRADGRLAAAESMLFWEALDAWNLRLDEVVGWRREPSGAGSVAAGSPGRRRRPGRRRPDALPAGKPA
jgi:hypothetical protein